MPLPFPNGEGEDAESGLLPKFKEESQNDINRAGALWKPFQCDHGQRQARRTRNPQAHRRITIRRMEQCSYRSGCRLPLAQELFIRVTQPTSRGRNCRADILQASGRIGIHAGMECFRRAMHGEQTFAGRSENLSQANKLSRSFAALLEALNRHRGKGQQKVTVEHVHVNKGGQAIVGNVTNAGGGSPAKSEEQPQANQTSKALEPAFPSPYEEEDALRVGGNELSLNLGDGRGQAAAA
jgi:hypothetical protein